MDPSTIYNTCRTRLVDLALLLTAEQLARPLAATPPWTVLDGYRHLTGVCVDVLDGAMQGAGSAAWTAAQLDAREGRDVADVCAEWCERAPALEAQVAQAGNAMAFACFDVWTHGQDIRAAVGFPSQPGEELVTSLAGIALATLGGYYTKSGAPTLRVLLDGGSGDGIVLGNGEPAVTLQTTSYELLRTIFGRRSRAQIEMADWSGEGAAAVIDAIHIFDCPAQPIDD
jgi:uncharacterized protein (TIGR03083 family)